MKKYKLLQEVAFDIPNVGGSLVLKPGTIIEGEYQGVDGGTVETDVVLFDLPVKAGSTEKFKVSVPASVVEEHKEAKYNWLYLAAAGALVFWFVTRDKKRKPEAIPGF